MRPRWLLLAVSVVILLVLAPVAAFSQQPQLGAGCGTATMDGRVGAVEWANAATVPLFEEELTDGVGPQQPRPTPPSEDVGALPPRPTKTPEGEFGTAYFMHEGEYLYVGAILGDPENQVPDDPTNWDLELAFAFEDEPAGNPAAWVDCAWEAESCDLPEDEGMLFGRTEKEGPGSPEDRAWFGHWAAEHVNCEDEPLFTGVTYHAAPRGGGGHYEMRVDLETSPLNNVGVGDCFDLRWMWVYLGGERPNGWRSVAAGWPVEPVDAEPYEGECTILCLDPCEVEFVPEPGTILLLGSGFAGLAGYATLRLRSGQALRGRKRK